MIREKAGRIESIVEEIEETGELILVNLFRDEVDELFEEIWQLPKGQKSAYYKLYEKQAHFWRKRIKEVKTSEMQRV